jgi:hypothetical protein
MLSIRILNCISLKLTVLTQHFQIPVHFLSLITYLNQLLDFHHEEKQISCLSRRIKSKSEQMKRLMSQNSYYLNKDIKT